MTEVLLLNACHTFFGDKHDFVQIFSSSEKLEEYIKNNPQVTVVEVTSHILDDTSTFKPANA